MSTHAHPNRRAVGTPAELVVDGREVAEVVARVASHVMPSRPPRHAGACSSEGMERWKGALAVRGPGALGPREVIELASTSVDVRLRVRGEDYVIWLAPDEDDEDDEELSFIGSGPSPRG